MLKFILLCLFCVVIYVDGQNPCLTNNGNCGEICLWKGVNTTKTCSCGCGKTLDANGLTCSPFPCNVNIDFHIDIGRGAAVDYCNLPINANLVPWKSWVNTTADVLTEFITESQSGRYRISANAFFTNQNVQTSSITLTTLAQNNITQAVDILRSIPKNRCISGNYLLNLQNDYSMADFNNFPGSNESPTNIGIVFTTKWQSLLPPGMLETMIAAINSRFDAVVIVLHTPPAFGFVATMNSAFGCDNATYCPRLFNLNEGKSVPPLNKTTLLQNVNLDACAARRVFSLAAVVTCGSQIKIDIPKCLLKGLGNNMLQFIDPGCVVNFENFLNDPASIVVPLSGCGLKTQIVGNTITLHQRLSTRIFNANQHLPSVSFNISCSYNKSAIPTSPLLRSPVGLENNISAISMITLKNVSLNIFLNPNFTNPLAAGACIQVNCPVFFEISAEIPPNSFLTVTSCIATPYGLSNSSTTYWLLKDSCPKDTSFRFIPRPNDGTVGFSMNMFEFSSTYFKSKESKIPVGIHCNVMLCSRHDVSQACKPNCTRSRQRRSVDESTGYMTSFDTFVVERGPAIPKAVADSNTAYITVNDILDSLEQSFYSKMLWVGAVVIVLLLLVLGKMQTLDNKKNKQRECSECDHFVLTEQKNKI